MLMKNCDYYIFCSILLASSTRSLNIQINKDMPPQLVSFLSQFFSQGSSTDKSLLTKFELDRIFVDDQNCLYSVTQSTKDFLRLYFVIGKGLILSVLLNEDGFGVKLDSSSAINLKIIASVIYYAMIDTWVLLVSSKNEYKDSKSESYEPISALVFSDEQLAYMFVHHPDFYHDELKPKINMIFVLNWI